MYVAFWKRVPLLKTGSERIGCSLMQREGSILACFSVYKLGVVCTVNFMLLQTDVQVDGFLKGKNY